MPVKRGPAFTFSLPGGGSQPCSPVNYATANIPIFNIAYIRYF